MAGEFELMPYIEKEDREEIDSGERVAETPGELAYVIYSTVMDYFNEFPEAGYVIRNDILGVLEGVKQEFYRRHVSTYEDFKIEVNGDVE